MLSAASVSVHAQGRGNGQAKKTAVSAPKAKGASQTQSDTENDQSRDARGEGRGARDEIYGEGRDARRKPTKAARKSPTMTSTTTTTGTTTVVTPTTLTTQSVKNPKLEARLLALLPPNTTIQEASQGLELGPIRRRHTRLEQPEDSVRRSQGEDDGYHAGHAPGHDQCRPRRCRSARRFNRSRTTAPTEPGQPP